MLVGHTKFSPDRFFGLIKKTYRLSTVSTINELERVVQRSSVEQTIPQLIRDIFGVLQVTFHQWTMFLSNLYTPIPNISKYHCFRASADNPGIVFVREFYDSPKMQLTILKKGLSLEALNTTMPEKTTIRGLDINRQWYLCEHIRPHCKTNLVKDMTCPRPTQSKPGSAGHREESITREPDQPPLVTPPTKRTRLCSSCKTSGHTKRTCPLLK